MQCCLILLASLVTLIVLDENIKQGKVFVYPITYHGVPFPALSSFSEHKSQGSNKAVAIKLVLPLSRRKLILLHYLSEASITFYYGGTFSHLLSHFD